MTGVVGNPWKVTVGHVFSGPNFGLSGPDEPFLTGIALKESLHLERLSLLSAIIVVYGNAKSTKQS